MSESSDKCAAKLFAALFPLVRWDYTDHEAKPLLRAAFVLYEAEWKRGQGRGSAFSITRWQWPFDAFERGATLTSLEPWTVLFAKVAELHHMARK